MIPHPDYLDVRKDPPGPELFIGLVGPVGVNVRTIQSILVNSLKRLSYDCVEVKLSQWISGNCASVDASNDYMKLKSLMLAGSDCRRLSSRGEFLALAGLQQIWEYRKSKMGTYPDSDIPRIKPFTCYIFNQLKHPDEVKILRWIYGGSFYLIGASSPLHDRQKNLAERIENTSEMNLADCNSKAQELVELDYSEEGGDDFGQSIQKTFPKADVFFSENHPELLQEIDRFVDLIFSNPFHSPTKDEQSMCFARAASLRSADLARQIGAAITTERGEMISIGCNEAARPGGGQYWSDDRDIEDMRDFKRGFDSNDRAKADILTNLLNRIRDENALSGDADELVAAAVAKKNKLASATLFDVIEYFRSVHAEMAALIDAARRGIVVQNATMYATTFPCHECAKHIVAAGVRRLVYIEPYPKSRALELFEDAIALDHTRDIRTVFESFVGIAPRRYSELFDVGSLKRKDSSGKKLNWTYGKARLRKPELETTYAVKESYYKDLFDQSSALVIAALHRHS
jgi:cytidine deaminase